MTVVYSIDADDVITEVNDAWVDFALDNDGEALATSAVGTSLWSHITDERVTDVFRALVRQARTGGASVRYDYRCDSPAVERHMSMTIEPQAAGAIRFSSETRHIVPRKALPFLMRFLEQPTEVRMCGICARVSVDAVWMNVGTALSEGHLEVGDRPHDVHPSVCPRCEVHLRETN